MRLLRWTCPNISAGSFGLISKPVITGFTFCKNTNSVEFWQMIWVWGRRSRHWHCYRGAKKYYRPQMKRTSLLILPTSLVYNWVKEAEKFVPKLRILTHSGSNRAKDAYAFTHFDLVITTYGILRSDAELF